MHLPAKMLNPLYFHFLADSYYSPVSNKETLLSLNTDLGAEKCDVDACHCLHIRVDTEQGTLLFENVALYRMALKFI